jgi:hypothetical protein
MKKSFTLKAFALGVATAVALSASATPNGFLLEKIEKNAKKPVPAMNQTVAKQEVAQSFNEANATFNGKVVTKKSHGNATIVSKAPAKKAAANYGEWSDQGDCDYTFNMIFNSATTISHKYQRREDLNNPGNFQVKVLNFLYSGTGVEGVTLTLTVEKQIYTYSDGTTEDIYVAYADPDGVDLGFTIGDNAGNSYECYMYDHYNWVKALQPYYPDRYTDTVVESWSQACQFDPETGYFYLMTVYVPEINEDTAGMAVSWCELNSDGTAIETYYYDYLRLYGDQYKNYDLEYDTDYGYFNHAKDATTGTYTLDFTLNDNAKVACQILQGSKSNNSITSAQQELASALASGSVDTSTTCVLTEDGTAVMPISNYKKGKYTIVGVYTADGENYYAFSEKVNLIQEDLDFYDAGTADLTDFNICVAMQLTFGSSYSQVVPTDTYEVTVPMQCNSTVAGEYRLIHPYKQYHQEYLSEYLYYFPEYDYTYFNVSDYNKSYLKANRTGLVFGTTSGSYYEIGIGSSNQYELSNPDADDMYGTYADGELTFPETDFQDEDYSQETTISPISVSFLLLNTSSFEVTEDETYPSIYTETFSLVADCSKSGVQNVAADAQDLNAPVEYFNLQGIRVMNPEAGQLLIQRQGNKATKVVIR